MGCHTWFYNKISEMPPKDLEKIKKLSLDNINSNKILSCTYDEWVATVINWRLDPGTIKQFTDKGFYNDRINHLKWAKSILEAESMDFNSLVVVFKEFGGLFDDEYYELGHCDWGDNYRVYGYPEDKFFNAKTAIDFLWKYDQTKIKVGKKVGMCEEIENIINNFFKEYPNGYIEYG